MASPGTRRWVVALTDPEYGAGGWTTPDGVALLLRREDASARGRLHTGGMTTTSDLAYRPLTAIPLSAVIAAAAASLVNFGISLAAGALGADGSFPGLQPIAFLTLTVVAAIGGAIGWHLINRFSRRPRRVLTWLVPAFLAVSLIPDVFVGLSFGWPNAIALALMHVATVVVAVAVYRLLLPLKDRREAR